MAGYDYATERARLFSEDGLQAVQAITSEATRLCRAAGVVRADKAWATARVGDSWLLLAAVDYLVETGVLIEVTGSGSWAQHRVFQLPSREER